MKTPFAVTALLCLLALCACKAGKPGKIESTVMGDIKHHVTIGGKDWKNPIPYSPDVAKDGQEHFGHHCGICHGLDGQNTGVPFAQKMEPPVADLASRDVQEYTDGQLKWIIENGIDPSGMPGWKGVLTDEEMWKIVLYMRHLPPKGSLGIPAVFKEEAEEHEKAEHGQGKSAEPAHKH